jgi:hypothetical protein
MNFFAAFVGLVTGKSEVSFSSSGHEDPMDAELEIQVKPKGTAAKTASEKRESQSRGGGGDI